MKSSASAEVATLKERVKDRDRELADSQEKRAALETEHGALCARIQLYETANATLLGQVESLEKQKSQLDQELSQSQQAC